VNGPQVIARQVRFTNLAFWRNPASAFFTFAFPLMFLVIFTSLLGSGRDEVAPGVFIDRASYYVAAMSAFSVITATYTNLAVSVSFQRDAGILKRLRGSPLPGSAYLSARVMHAIFVSVLLVILTTAWGVLLYEAVVPTGSVLLKFIVTVIVGGMSFSALGLATTALVPNAEAAPAVVNGLILPLLFLSGVFFPVGPDAPAWMRFIADVFPVRHFTQAMLGSFYGPPAAVFRWKDVIVVALWGIAGLILAIRFFSWEPRK
jgi:ABC-2 type transport system permease protein